MRSHSKSACGKHCSSMEEKILLCLLGAIELAAIALIVYFAVEVAHGIY